MRSRSPPSTVRSSCAARSAASGERHAAVIDARHVEGVYDIDDQLQVRILDGDRRADADIRGVALEALHRDNEVPEGLIDVKVTDGCLKLTGEVSYQFQSNAAYYDLADVLRSDGDHQ